MKIFMSHSSRQKLFVKELRKYLPSHLNLWIDEREILIGANIDITIEEAILNQCDFFIIVIDEYALSSSWVLREIEWALKREVELNRVFLLPIVIEENAWASLRDVSFKNRRYLICHDFTDVSIESLSKKLTTEILGWLCIEYESKGAPNKASKDQTKVKYLGLLEEADRLSETYAEEIKSAILPYRRNNPITVEAMFALLSIDKIFEGFSIKEFVELLANLQLHNKLKGIYYDGGRMYLQRESYGYKEKLHRDLKKEIALRAFDFIQPGQVIAIDGGSTTLELAKMIGNSIKMNELYDLNIVTNSLTAANEILHVLSDLNVRDYNDLCNVYLIGGRARSISFTIVSNEKEEAGASLGGIKELLDKFNGADVAFLGTNGIKETKGFAVSNIYELRAKREMIESASRKVILCDPSKFLVSQDKVFASFDDELTIITIDDGKSTETINKFRELISGRESELIVIR